MGRLREGTNAAAGTITRRRFLRLSRDLSVLAAWSSLVTTSSGEPRWPSDPFSLGIASGDPWPTGVVLWTRLDTAIVAQTGNASAPIRLRWEIAEDDRFHHIVQRGTASAVPELGHSVHVEVDGLRPDRHYWYRFAAGTAVSPTGRTRTAPAAAVDRFRFAFASCQNYENGLYTSLGHLAEEDLRLIVHLGDYIYEGGIGRRGPRHHNSSEIETLDQYRERYRLYKSDPQLQAAHASCPWVVTWDDHELSNDYAGLTNASGLAPDLFLRRRAAAYQAYYEFLPLRRSSLPHGPDAQMYRRIECGPLVQFHVLDTRQYRSAEACTAHPPIARGLKARCEDLDDTSRTMLGAVQEQWLARGLRTSAARWNVIANQVMLGEAQLVQQGLATYSMDAWDGYPDARARLIAAIDDISPSNPIVISGDAHSSWVHELTRIEETAASHHPVAAEFVGTSLSSGGDGDDWTGDEFRAVNRHLSYYRNRRGYVRVTATPSACTVDYRVVPYVSTPGAPVFTDASFVVPHGRARAERA